MASSLLAILTCLAIITTATLSDASPSQCKKVEKSPPSKSFCDRPPTVPVDLKAYSGLWYNIYSSGAARRFTRGTCITANYSLTPNGKVAVLNCNIVNKKIGVQCVKAIAERRKDVSDEGKLVVKFENFPSGPSNRGNYNVAALIGSASAGYWAAAVYQCDRLSNGTNGTGFYILSRSRYLSWVTLLLLKLKLRCFGYDVNVNFERTPQKNCRYFNQSPGFTLARPRP